MTQEVQNIIKGLIGIQLKPDHPKFSKPTEWLALYCVACGVSIKPFETGDMTLKAIPLPDNSLFLTAESVVENTTANVAIAASRVLALLYLK